MTDLEIAKCLSNECDDSQTMVNFLQNKLDIEIITCNRFTGNHEFETCYHYNKKYISSRNDKSSAIVMGIWKFLSDEQRQILENTAKEIQTKNNQNKLDTINYKAEKSKGGSNSYKHNKPLKKKVETLCLEILDKKPDTPALQLADQVSKIIVKDFKDLLEDFAPYQIYENDGSDWTNKTFYNWCNNTKKSYNSK